MTDTAPRWASHAATREYLAISDATLYRYAAAGTVTRHVIGKSVRYDLNQVNAALRDSATPPPERAPSEVADVIARIRAALPPDVPGAKPLIQIARVHAAIDKVALELGVES